jgi:hypothetical protein
MIDKNTVVQRLKRHARWLTKSSKAECDLEVRRQYLKAAESIRAACGILQPTADIAQTLHKVATGMLIPPSPLAVRRELVRLSDTASEAMMRWAICRDAVLLAARVDDVANYLAVVKAVLAGTKLTEIEMLCFDWKEARQARETCLVVIFDIWKDGELFSMVCDAFGQRNHRHVRNVPWERQRDTAHYHAAINALAEGGAS